MARVVGPIPNRDDQFFWAGVENGQLLSRRCARCSHLQHPPAPLCRICGSVTWQELELTGRGTVHSWIVSRHPNQPDEESRIVAVIELADGIRLVSNLRNVEPDQVTNDMPVELTFAEVGGVRLPQFQPVGVRG